MKFLKHLAAVLLVVAVIVALGLLWAHAAGGGNAIGGAGRPPSHEAGARLQQVKQVKAATLRVRLDSGFDLARTRDLIQACVIEAVVAAVVITVSATRRQQRRKRRTATPSSTA